MKYYHNNNLLNYKCTSLIIYLLTLVKGGARVEHAEGRTHDFCLRCLKAACQCNFAVRCLHIYICCVHIVHLEIRKVKRV